MNDSGKQGNTVRSRLTELAGRLDLVFWAFLVAAIAVSVTEYLKGVKPLYGDSYFHYNNYLIFKYSFHNLLALKDLYITHPELYTDLYKYSPTFALFMAPMAFLPDYLGLAVWNLLNTLPIWFAVRWYPELTTERRAYILWLLLVDIMTCLHNAQSNGLMIALLIFALVAFERHRIALAALCLVATVFIKLFGLVAFMLFLLYPQRLKFIGWAVLWTALLALLPVVVVPPEYLIRMYQSWLALLLWDQGWSLGLSLFGLTQAWFGLELPKLATLLIGGVLLMLPLLRRHQYDRPLFRLLLFCSAVIWMIIFNHKAESNTFVIAMAGILFWYFAQPTVRYRTVLLVAAVLLISLSPTDLFPAWVRTNIVAPFELKALPAIAVWFVIQWQLLVNHFQRRLVY